MYRTIGMAWNGFKEACAQLEKAAQDLSTEDMALEKQVNAEQLEYEKQTLNIENSYLSIRKKRQNARDEVKRV